MNLIEALRTGLPLRRPISKHKGSGKTGWLSNQFVRDLLTSNNRWNEYCDFNLITEQDLLALDWETQNE